MFKIIFAGDIISSYQEKLNFFLVEVFNEILRIEEDCLQSGEFKDLSVREMHVIEAVCNSDKTGNNRASDIAEALYISAGTLTTEVALLEKKGCLLRRQDAHDRRIVRLHATERGIKANEAHQEFHRKMVTDVMDNLSGEETESLVKGLESLAQFFSRNK